MFKVFQVWENDGDGVHDSVFINLTNRTEAVKLAEKAFGGRVTEITVYDSFSESPMGKNETLQASINAKLARAGLTKEEMDFLNRK